METTFALVMAFAVRAVMTDDQVEPTSGPCLSRFDYDYKLMQKIINLETDYTDFKSKVREYMGIETHQRNTACPDGWIAYKGSCYLFGSDDVIFTVAEEYCRQHGGRLVHVETYEENLFLKGLMKHHLKDANFWLGMTDEITEGVWKWYGSDKAVGYFDWGPTEPQDFGSGEDCALFYLSIQFVWVDASCLGKAKAVCEK